MSARRFWTIFVLAFKGHVLRTPFWVMVALTVMLLRLATWDTVHSPGAEDGVYLNAELAVACFFPFFFVHFPSFFLSLAAGRTVSQDEEYGVDPLFHATPLTPGEYLWAKFAAVMAAYLGAAVLECLAMALFCGPLKAAAAPERFGPFLVRAYLWPVLVLILPLQTFLAGMAFGLGTRVRNLLVLVLLPLALFLGTYKFAQGWRPDWVAPWLHQVMTWLEPTGMRWVVFLPEGLTGAFFNESRLHFDLPFLISRAAWAGVGLGFVAWSLRAFRREVRGFDAGAVPAAPAVAAPATPFSAEAFQAPLRRPGTWEALGTVFRLELRTLASQPGWYLFGALALVDTFMRFKSAADPLTGVSLLLTSGGLAVHILRNLSLILCLLLLFATGEALDRERVARLEPLVASSPMPSLALRGGKVLAGLALAGVLGAAEFLLGMGLLAVQGEIPLRPGTFLAVGFLILVPTLLVWTAFVWAVHELTRNRLTTYAVGLSALVATGLAIYTGHMTWAGNWPLFDNLVWSDLSPLEMDRAALVLNRLMVLSLAGFLAVLAWAVHARRERDGAAVLARLCTANRRTLGLLALAAVPALLVGLLDRGAATGPDGEAMEARRHAYWRRNVNAWKGAPLPEARSLDLDLELDLRTRSIQGQGAWVVRNTLAKPLAAVPLTVPYGYDAITWTLDGAPCVAEDRAGLHILPVHLEPGQERRVGFQFRGRIFPGSTRNGGPWAFFLLPSGGLLRHRLLVPTLGFQEDLGVTDATLAEPPGPGDRRTGPRPPVGSSLGRFTARLRLSGPADFDYLSIGTRAEDHVEGGRRSVLWASDGPVGAFCVQVGRWNVQRGLGAEVYYDPAHGCNVPSLLAALEAARERYTRWYGPIPYPQFRLAEFPGLAPFATSMPGAIPFSENFGFLCRKDERFDQAFGVAAHEASHQWWGNLVTPCEEPGAKVITEGMANFSAALLFEEVKGPGQRRAFMRLMETLFVKGWSATQDRPLLDDRLEGPGGMAAGGSRAYNKGAWAFWMLMDHLGREPFMAGLRDFIAKYREAADHPDLQDLLGALRARTQDPAAFDAFVGQWFGGVDLPRFRVASARRVRRPEGGWQVEYALENQGGTRMPVQVALTAGSGTKTQELLDQVTLGPGDKQSRTLACPFRPERLTVDPEVRVLQLGRRSAEHRF